MKPPAAPNFRIVSGFPETARDEVARLFWEAFSGKIGLLMRPDAHALAFLRATLRPEFAFSALSETGEVLGVIGIKTERGGLVSGGFRDVANAYGVFSALWRAPLLDMLERPLAPGQLLLDGIFVSAQARGLGVGTALIHRILEEAAARECSEVRLDVIDTNPRARALYTRLGFEPAGVEHLGPLRLIFGFRTSTRMIYRLSD
ncbi:MAG: GNAT family N-acetyltransferase [Pseudomonadota bacterium]